MPPPESLCVSSALRTEFHGLCQRQTCEIQFFSWGVSAVVDRSCSRPRGWEEGSRKGSLSLGRAGEVAEQAGLAQGVGPANHSRAVALLPIH